MAKKNKIERRYIDDLVNEVNNLDKNIGIKLKKPDIFSEPAACIGHGVTSFPHTGTC